MSKVRTVSATVNVSVVGNAQVKLTLRVTENQARRSLKFGQGNAKLADGITTFSLPAGFSCPFARDCLSKADRKTGTIQDGKHLKFRCYATSMECRHSNVRRSRWHNFDLLRACGSIEEMAQLILDSLSPFTGYVRIHESGDFFSQDYFDAWVLVAQARPRTTFYSYTKALPFWVRRSGLVGDGFDPGKVSNFVLTASHAGTHDHLIQEHRLRSARVVFTQAEADDLGLEVDHDDSHAIVHGPSFSLLLHGQQPKGSEAAMAGRSLRDSGFSGYGATKTRLPLNVL